MFNAIDELKPISNTLLTRFYDDVRIEYPQAFHRINNALAITNEQTHHTAGVQLAINNVKAQLQELLDADRMDGETLLHELTDLIQDMENIAVAQSHKITPHKGGRVAHLPRGRVTPEERQRIDRVLAETGLSFADWVMAQLPPASTDETENVSKL
jgi:hypothetical protein